MTSAQRQTRDLDAPVRAEAMAAELDVVEERLNRVDPEATMARAVAIERAAEALGERELWQRARLLQADLRERRGDGATAIRTIWEINAWAAEHACRPLLLRTHYLLARTFSNLGDLAACLEHGVMAVELLDDTTPPGTRAHCLVKLADALGWNCSFDAARERYRQAEQVAAACGDVERQLLVLNNLAQTEYDADQPERAWAAMLRVKAVAAAHGRELDASELDTLARVHIALGRHAEAERTARRAIDVYHADGFEEADELAEYLLTLAVAQRCQGANERAQANLDRSRALCDQRELAEVRLRVDQEQAELYGAAGDFERAFAGHKAFHAGSEKLRRQQQEARAFTRQAMFETTEARREAERFREQACRDPLTGLRNRRYVDEQLPALLDRAATAGGPLVLALADLDHFKRINDTCSHGAGDQVLVTVARLLAEAVTATAPEGFAARMGGEEFLLALAGVTAAEAIEGLEALRAAVAAHDWRPVIGDLPVTVSIGATIVDAATRPGQAELLAAADRNLYAAKHRGRNRLASDPYPLGEPRRYRDAPGRRTGL
jgi:diguanylate cyclase (GGDEF)-like protein